MNNKFRILTLGLVSTLSINSALALPIDWTGVFGADTHLLSNTCRTSDAIPTKIKSGSQGLQNGDCDMNFQSYTLRLNPNIIVNDGVTLKGELSTGHFRGNFAGSDSANNQDGSANNSYFFTTPAQRSALNINQMYMEMYADTALIKIGRMSRHFGLGMVFDNGNDPWDRFLTIYDGIEAEMKIGNFSVTPHFAKISSYDNKLANTSRPGEPAGNYDVREMGLVAKYDNKNKDFMASLLYAKRSSERNNTLYNSGDENTGTQFSRKKTSVTVIEPFVSKRWNKLKIAAEASLQSGDYGEVYKANEKSKLSAQAYIAEVKYDLNPKWDIGLLAGQASGDDGSTSKFEAAYLHPNFHIADLMFRYNYAAINEGGRSIFDSSITNARFFKLYGNYKADNWTWKTAFIMANALETAQGGGKNAYHHEENYRFQSQQKQDDSYGYELDFGFDYRWNPNVVITGYYAYWKVGDYYAFSNNATTGELSLANVHGGGLKATLEF